MSQVIVDFTRNLPKLLKTICGELLSYFYVILTITLSRLTN